MRKLPYLILLSLTFVMQIAVAQVDEISEHRFTSSYGHEKLSIPISSNHVMHTENDAITRLVVVIHGTYRNSTDYFKTIAESADLAKISQDSLMIVAPQFLTDKDRRKHRLGKDHLSWSGGGWLKGSLSSKESRRNTVNRVSSFAVMDALLLHLTRILPNLETIVITGHSAGGQFTQRYAISSPTLSQLNDNSTYSVKCIVANASSYTYLSDERPVANGTGFEVPESSKCDDYNIWKYGLENRYKYHEGRSAEKMIQTYKKLQVAYLVGELDNDPQHENLDKSCEAQLQGAHRLERAIRFYDFLIYFFGDKIKENHELHSVPNAGHSSAEMYQSEIGLRALFGAM